MCLRHLAPLVHSAAARSLRVASTALRRRPVGVVPAYTLLLVGLVLLPPLQAVKAGPARPAELVVSAAASLSNAFTEIGAEFERTRSGVKLVFNFAASDVLVRQVIEGAPVDILAAADEQAMDQAVKADAVDPSTRLNFAANRLVLAVSDNAMVPLSSLEDLRRKEVRRIAIGQPAVVPAGRYAKAALEQARLWDVLRDKFIYTQNVRQTLDYVTRGETDAGFVYASDLTVAKGRTKLAFHVATPRRILYPIAVSRLSNNKKIAGEFIQFVLSAPGRTILQKSGFGTPQP